MNAEEVFDATKTMIMNDDHTVTKCPAENDAFIIFFFKEKMERCLYCDKHV